VDRDVTEAFYTMRNVTLFDHYNVANALAGGPADRAIASFAVHWEASGKPFKMRDEENRFVGDFRIARSTVEWESQGSGFGFRSDPANTSTTVFSVMGRERNGEFFS
jgi:hypothetical protein